MRNLKIVFVMMGILINEPAIAQTVDSLKATAEITDYRLGEEQGDRLESAAQGVYGDTYRGSGYKGLIPNFYFGIIPGKETKTTSVPEAIVIDTDNKTPVNQNITGWVRPASTTCECGEGCQCPPLVCDKNYCKDNYVVVFGSDDIQSRKMWKTVTSLRNKDYVVFYIDIKEHPAFVSQFKLTSEPTTLVLNKGHVTHRWNGVVSQEDIEKVTTTRQEQGIDE